VRVPRGASDHGRLGPADVVREAGPQGLRVLAVSFAALALTAGVEAAVFALSGSVAVLTDAVHNLADAFTAVPIAAAFVLGRRAPTPRYTYGYGRAEDLAAVGVVAALAASAGSATWLAVARLGTPAGRTPVHDATAIVAAGLVGFLGNELVARYRVRAGRRIGSAALVADGLHARVDGLASLAVVAGGVGVALGFPLADPMAALLIALPVAGTVLRAAREVAGRLMDAVDPRLVERARTVLEAVPGVEAVGAVRIRWIGHELHAEAEIGCAGEQSLTEAHRIAEEAHHALLHALPWLAEATIHVNPSGEGGLDAHETTAHHRRGAGGA
jgi:cation diffusion facilitator family transporter